jgi:hypothetical protein
LSVGARALLKEEMDLISPKISAPFISFELLCENCFVSDRSNDAGVADGEGAWPKKDVPLTT